MDAILEQSRRRVAGGLSNAAPTVLKEVRSYAPFFRGGDVAFAASLQALFCPCGNEVTMVSASSGCVLHTFPGDGESVTTIAVHPRGKSLIVFSRSGMALLYDITSKTLEKKWKPHADPVLCASFDATGALLATAGSDKAVRVWDLRKGHMTHIFRGHSGLIQRLVFHPNPTMPYLVSSSEDTSVRVWDLMAFSCAYTVTQHASSVTAVHFDNWTLCCASRDRTLSFHDLRDMACTSQVAVLEEIEDMITVPSLPKLFVVGLRNGAVSLINHAGKQIASISLSPLPVRQLFSGDSDRILAVAEDLNIYNARVHASSIEEQSVIIGNQDEIIDIARLSRESLVLATNSPEVRVFNLVDGSSQLLRGHADTVLCVASSLLANRMFIVSGSKDQSVRVWDAGTCVFVGKGHTAPVTSVAFLQNIIVSVSEDCTLKVWSIAVDKKGEVVVKPIATVVAHDKPINAVAISPDASRIATASQDKSIKIWALDVNNDRTPIELRHTCKGHRKGVWTVAFSQVDKQIASGAGDGSVRLWNVKDGACFRVMGDVHTGSVLRVSFFHGSIASVGADGSLVLSDPSTGAAVFRSSDVVTTTAGKKVVDDEDEEGRGKLWALCLGEDDEQTVYTGGVDGALSVWKDMSDAAAEEVVQKSVEDVKRAQELETALRKGDHAAAFVHSVKLQMGHVDLYRIVEKWVASSGEETVKDELGRIMAKEKEMLTQHLPQLLNAVRDLNVYPKTADVAQLVLSSILLHINDEDIFVVDGVKDVLRALSLYTVRHYDRINRQLDTSHLVPFTLRQMDRLLAGDVNAATEAAGEDEDEDIVLSDAEDDGVEEVSVEEAPVAKKRRITAQ